MDRHAKLDLRASLKRVEAGGIPLRAEQRLAEEAGEHRKLFTSDLSVSEYLLARDAGCEPISQVMGSCIFHVGQGPSGRPTENKELTQITQSLYDARELAMERMQVEAEALGAAGIVGVTIDENNHTWGPSILEFSAVGTAVVPIRDDHHIPKPTLVLSVGD